MGDHVEIHITPETPGRPSIRNPFESPNDYLHLKEPLVPSPSIFKSKPSRATPPKFNWSIDEMASLLPVHIDPEEIQQQSFYLSQTRMDSDIEEKRQHAIEQFFTKGGIVPSPWASSATRKTTQINLISSMSPMIAEEPEKLTVACQTVLSLPATLDLEKVLGEYYHHEACESVQENLSSSSLRRKLFLDGQGSYSGSDSSNPSSPERGQSKEQRPPLVQGEGPGGRGHGTEGEALLTNFASPVACCPTTKTPSTGQFSSSPIQNGGFRDCSLGSIDSPLFPDRSSPAGLISPVVSPIGLSAARTPVGSAERKRHSALTPDSAPVDMDANSCSESPYVEGCSPIRSCSLHQLHCHSDLLHNVRPKPRPRVRHWASPPLISPILYPKLQDNQVPEDQPISFCVDPSPPLSRDLRPSNDQRVGLDQEPVKMEQEEEEEEEEEEESGMVMRLGGDEEEGEAGGLPAQLTSSRMGNVSATESSQMFLSLLAEGSSIRCDSSMQVDSGYNTTSAGTASLVDGLSSDCHSKESFTSNMEDVFQPTRNSKVKVLYPHY
ncbi:protein aurora borealis [Genypterus blacodes]|uniref:protein aurora borealis n=1 Tax=Genypterus blacodes TaxID=154954 RepID=UPI003F76E75A